MLNRRPLHHDRAAALARAVLKLIELAPPRSQLEHLESLLRDEITSIERQIAGERELPDA